MRNTAELAFGISLGLLLSFSIPELEIFGYITIAVFSMMLVQIYSAVVFDWNDE
jgi:small basic protein